MLAVAALVSIVHVHAAPPNLPPPPPPPLEARKNASKGPGKLVVESNFSSSAAAQAARARMAKGDCAGALDAFDEALRTSVDPVLHRDRGVCHDRLQHPYPAMDDYREYVTAMPNAPDAERIRQRLEELRQQAAKEAPATGTTAKDELELQEKASKGGGSGGDKGGSKGGSKAEASAEAKSDEKKGSGGSASGNASMSIAVAAASDDGSGKGSGNVEADSVDAEERRGDEAERSPLRKGTGFIIGAQFGMHAWATSGNTLLGTQFTVALRGSISSVSTIMGELGYITMGREKSALQTMSGPTLYGAYEYRLGLDPLVTNALVVQLGLGYERLKQSGIGLTTSSVHPKVRFGWRHVFGPSLGFEATAEGGYALLHVVDAPAGADADSGAPVVGGSLALLIGP